MRILLQRVSSASVTVDEKTIGAIDQGFCILLGIGHDDTTAIADKMADKLVKLRVFNDPDGKFNLSLLDVRGQALVISQFTLYADARKGRRPGFTDAAKPDHASVLCDYFTDKLKQLEASPAALEIKLECETLDRLDEIWPGPGGESPEYFAW